MKAIVSEEHVQTDVLEFNSLKKETPLKNKAVEAFTELERGVYAALETYSNVHRGSGHNSMVSTHLYEEARNIVLEYLGLDKGRYTVIFCSPGRAAGLMAQLKPKSYQLVSSKNIGLSIGMRALAVKKKALPGGVPFQTGGGTTKLMSGNWVIWANAPDKFEAGTPAIINAIAFAKALRLTKQYGKDIFMGTTVERRTAAEILYNDELVKYSGLELLGELRKNLVGRGVRVPTMEGDSSFINLDNSASTPTFTPVWKAFRQTWHQPEQVQQDIVHEVRSICSGVLDAPLMDYDILFTSNTTEAINLAAENLSREFEEDTDTVVLNTLLEHSSNDLPWRMVPRSKLIRLKVDAEGFIDLNELETLLCSYNQKGQYGKRRIKLVAVSGASNVLGICNNLDEISQMVHRYGARLLVDAAQLVAHRKVNMEESNIDYLAFSAHKVYAPFGCGVLVVKKDLLHFNSTEMKLIQSSGEENAGGIAALGKALVLMQRIGLDLVREEEQVMTAHILRGLVQINGLKLFGIKDPESPVFAYKIGVIVFYHDKIMSNIVAKELALRSGIGVRYGCHCAHIIIKRLLNVSPSLERFQWLIQTLVPGVRLPGLVRVSLGIENTNEDIDRFIHVLDKIAGKDNRSASAQNGNAVVSKQETKQQMNNFVKASALRIYSQQ